jgi:hypothetical protein
MVASRPQRVRQEYGRFVQCCGRQKAHNASNGIWGDFPLETKCGLLSSHKQHPPHPFGGLCYDKHPVWALTVAVTIPIGRA